MAPPWAVDEGGRYDVTIPQGKTWRETLIYAEDVDAAGNPVDPISLAGLAARAQVRRWRSKVAPLILDITPHITLEAASATGHIDIEVPATVTALVEHSGYFDLELYDPLNLTEVAEVVHGRASLDKEVTA